MVETRSDAVGPEPQSDTQGRRPEMVDLSGAPGAPLIIFFEAPGGVRFFDGIITIGLAATKTIPMSDNTTEAAAVAVGYLKGTRSAFIGLHKAIEDAFLLGTETKGKGN